MENTVRRIDPKDVLADMRAGMPDSALMEKYQLSAAGLQSLVKKLGILGAASHSDSFGIITDVKAGMSDLQLMEKYGLSPEGLRGFFQAFEGAVLRSRPTNRKVSSGGKVIQGKEIVEDICSGMTRWKLMEKYQLSYAELQQVVKIVLRQRERIAARIAEDVRSGMTDSELTEKYQLSQTGLETALKHLLKEGFLVSAELIGRGGLFQRAVSAEPERRQLARRSPALQVAVRDGGKPDRSGTVKDISERGLAVRGIEAQVGEVKTLAILGDDLGYVDPFEVEAQCRWVTRGGADEGLVAGFLIVTMSDEDLASLKMFIHLIDLGVSPTWPH